MECSATNRTSVTHTTHKSTPGSGTAEEGVRKESEAEEDWSNTVRCRPLHLWAHIGCGRLYKTMPVNTLAWSVKESMSPHPNWGAIES